MEERVRQRSGLRRARADLKVAEAALRDCSDHLRHAVELNPQFPWIADPQGHITTVHHRWLEVTGLTQAEALGEGWTRVPHPEDHGRVTEAWTRAVLTGEPFNVEARLPIADRSYRWWRVRALPQRDASGTIVRWYGTTEDIHDRKAAEARLAALVELGDRLRDLGDPAAIAAAAAEIVGRTLGVMRAEYGTIDAAEDTFCVARDWTAASVESAAGEHRIDDYWLGLVDDLRRGEVVVVSDVACDPRTAGHAANYLARGSRALASVPLVRTGRIVAVLHLQDVVERRWSAEEIGFIRGVAERAWAAARRARVEERQRLLLHEMNHRVKNTLAVVQSLALQTARGSPTPAAFAAAFQARLLSLARAHDLLTREHWEGAALAGVVDAALEPIMVGQGHAARVDLSGCAAPGVMLLPSTALLLAMALHELATNALKHGALSVPGGHISVTCRGEIGDGSMRVVDWTERGGPPVTGPPARRGFGLRLLERGLAAGAGVQADLHFEPDGVRCSLSLMPTGIAAAVAADD